MPTLLRASLLCACLLLAAPLSAAELSGTWRATKSGTLFHVAQPMPAAVASAIGRPGMAGAMIALRQPTRGRPSLFVTRWVQGMRGAQFRFGKKALATISPDGRQARFHSGIVWSRVSGARGAGAPAGWWRSSSGSVFMVTAPAGGRFFVANIKVIGPRSFIASAQWIQGMTGRQFRYGKSTATLAPGGRQMRVTGRKAHTWTLLARWGNPRPPARRVTARVKGMAGTWRNPRTGALLQIPAQTGRVFDVIWQSPDGRTARKLHANWVRGLRGTQLQFQRRRERVTCTWSSQRPGRLQVMGWDSRPQAWTRMR